MSQTQSAYLLKTKFYVPQPRPNQITRQRLLGLMNSSMDKTLTLVSAPAGYGKTTLVSSWLKEAEIPSAWLSLDDGDNDPIRFLQYLLTSLLPIAPGIDDLLDMLQGEQPIQFEKVITIFVNELALRSDPFALVLDDFHIVHSEVVLKMFSFLMEHFPYQMHLVLLTRTDPPLPLARLRVRGQLLDIRADQLRFTLDEVAAFLNEVMGLTLSTHDLSALEARTEGWIAGLQLAALSMRECKDIHGFVTDFAGSHHYVMDYLAEEVLRQQPRRVSDFLLQTSILDRLCGSLCEALVKTDSAEPVEGEKMLETLEEMNLFIIPLDDERHWYRYHHLFADVLKKRLESQFPHLLPELHRRASCWYEKNGFVAESIQQAIAAGEQDRAAHLIEENGCFLLISGEVATLLGWANTIEFQSEIRPWLAIQKGWAQALNGNLDQVEGTLQIPDKLLAPLEPKVEIRTMQGTITAARAYCANVRGDTQSAAEYAQQALKLLPDCSSISRSIRSVATSILGDSSRIIGRLDDAARAYTEAIRIGQEANSSPMIIIAKTNLADVFLEQGQLHWVNDIYTQALQTAIRPDGQRSPLAGSIYAGLGRLSYEYNRLDEANQYIHQCIELCQQWGDLDLRAAACAMLARLEQAQGNLEEAQKAAREAEQLAGEHSLSRWRAIQVKSDLGRFWLSQGNVERSFQLLQKDGLMLEDDIPYQRQPEYMLLLRVLLARSDYESTLMLSKRLLHQAEKAGRVGAEIETLVIQALAFHGEKDTERALTALEKALALAQPERYVRTFLDEGETMTRLLCQARSRQVGSSYAAELLSKIGGSPAMKQPSMQLLIEPLTAREVEVLKFIEAGCSNQEISDQLVISITTVKRHISNIYAKLDAKNRTQAVAIGKELKIFG